MMRLLFAVLLLGSSGVACAEDAFLLCKWGSDIFSVKKSSSGPFELTLGDEQMASMFSVESLRQRYPGMDDKMIAALAAQAGKMNVGEAPLGECSRMQACEFSPVGSPVLVACSKTLADGSVYNFALSLVDGVYKPSCSSVAKLETEISGVQFKGTKTSSSTFQSKIPPTSCRYN